MEGFIESMGYEPLLFESGDIPFHHDITLAEACYSEVRNSHMLVLIIGGRYGSAAEAKKKDPSSDLEKMYETYNSVTKNEYETARIKDIPIFIFVEKGVKGEYETFKSNRENTSIKYAHVDSVNVFFLLDDILTQKKNNFVKEFDKFEDIVGWLKEQWAGIFADILLKKKEDTVLADMSSQLSELNQVTNSLKAYTESIMRKVMPRDSAQIINKQKIRLREAKIIRFKKENMIEYLLTDTPEEQKYTEAEILFDAFERSTTLLDFFNKANMENNKRAISIITEYESIASNEYIELRQKYIEKENPDAPDISSKS